MIATPRCVFTSVEREDAIVWCDACTAINRCPHSVVRWSDHYAVFDGVSPHLPTVYVSLVR